MAKRLYYKIGEACKLLDIQPYVLRYWETEFPMLRPDKSSSGQRVYNDRDLATIRRIKELLYDEGYTIAGAKKKLDGEDLSELTAEAPDEAAKPAKAKEAKESKDAKEPKKAPEKKAEEPKKAAVKPAAKKAKSKAAEVSSDEADKLLKGVETALAEARGILKILDAKR